MSDGPHARAHQNAEASACSQAPTADACQRSPTAGEWLQHVVTETQCAEARTASGLRIRLSGTSPALYIDAGMRCFATNVYNGGCSLPCRNCTASEMGHARSRPVAMISAPKLRTPGRQALSRGGAGPQAQPVRVRLEWRPDPRAGRAWTVLHCAVHAGEGEGHRAPVRPFAVSGCAWLYAGVHQLPETSTSHSSWISPS